MFKHATGGWVLVALIAIATILRFAFDSRLQLWRVDSRMLDVLACAFLYAAVVVLIRWQMIALPIHSQINARLEAISVDLQPSAGKEATHGQAIRTLVAKARELSQRIDLLDILFWSRGQETALWRLIDEAELLMVESWSETRIETRLPALGEALKTLATPEAKQVAAQVTSLFTLPLPVPEAGSSRQLLLRECYLQGLLLQRNSLQKDDGELDYYNNKLMWYILIALTAIVLIANVLPNVPGPDSTQYFSYLIAGAVGGVLSRMTRAILPPSTPNEFGSRWMALFLSPLVGALAGWAGIILLDVATQLTAVTATNFPPNMKVTASFALAIVFGFSERLFTDLASKAEIQVLKTGDASPAKLS